MRSVERLQRALLDSIRLGLRADSGSVHQLAMKILRSPPGEFGDDAPMREELAKLVMEKPPSFTRGVAAPREPAGSEPSQPYGNLLRTETDSASPSPVVSDDVQAVVDQLVAERSDPEALTNVGLEPTRTVLLVGAPGVGKTMTARYLASRIGLPLVTADLAVMVSSYLGKTGQNLRIALDHARARPCLFLLDEFDAVGKRRDDPTDVGELKRIVNVLLLELERWPAHSLFVAATNHAELLDRAVWRRFDKIVRLDPPDARARASILQRTVAEMGQALDDRSERLCSAALEGTSGSDIVRFVRDVARSSIVRGRTDFAGAMREWAVQHLLESARQNDESARRLYCRIAHEVLGQSYREIAATLGVSHVTVGKLMKHSPAKAGRRVPSA